MQAIFIILYGYLAILFVLRLKKKPTLIISYIHLFVSSILLLPLSISLSVLIWPESSGVLGGLASLTGIIVGFPLGMFLLILSIVRGRKKIKKESQITWFSFYLIPFQILMIIIIGIEAYWW